MRWMMRRNFIWLFLFLFFTLEGSVIHWLIPAAEVRIAPHFVLVGIIYTALYLNRHFALLSGLVFGMLQGIAFYGYMIGAYSFGMGLCGYLASLTFRHYHHNIASTLFVIALSNLFYDTILYSLYRLFHITNLPFEFIFMRQMLPSLLLNLLFALMIYIPARFYLEQANDPRREEEAA